MASPSSMSRLDIGEQIVGAYRTVLDNAGLAVELALIPFVIALIGDIIAVLLSGIGRLGMIVAALILFIALLFPNAIFAVRWHRFVLLGEREHDGMAPPGWGRFVVAGLKLAAILLVGWMILLIFAALPPHVITMVLAALGTVALVLLAIGLLLIFPAAAIERPLSLYAAWTLLRGNYWRFLICFFGCHLPFVIANVLVLEFATGTSSLLLSVSQAIHLVVIYPGIAVVVALLSQVYRDLAGI